MKRGLTAVLAAAALAGCSGGDREQDPERIHGAPKQVANGVTRLESYVRAGRWTAICDELFSRAARRRAGGADCHQLLRSTMREVRRPRIRLLSIRVEGERAEVRVRTTSASQAAVDETIELVRERGDYRISALTQ